MASLLVWSAAAPVPNALADDKTSSQKEILAKKKKFAGDVVLIRGGFNVFSGGLDLMAAKLAKRGIKAKVAKHTQAQSIAASIIANQKKYGRKPVILVGHSWGANTLLEVAEILKKKRIRIAYAATFAATNPGRAPNNIRKLTNYYFKKDGWGKVIRPGRGFRGRLKNIDMSTSSSVNHFNIEENPKLQRQVINNIRRFLKRNRVS